MPMGRAMLNIVMTFAQLERETIAGRAKDNHDHRFGLGAWPGGPGPSGSARGAWRKGSSRPCCLWTGFCRTRTPPRPSGIFERGSPSHMIFY
jgi:hypothetical protein